MRVRAVFFRLFGVLAIIAGVFFASFFMAIAMRQPHSSNAASAAMINSATPPTAPKIIEPLVSEEANTVPTTDQSTSTTSTTSTTIVVRDQGAPRLAIDPVFDVIHDRLATEVRVPVRLPETFGDEAADWVPTIGSIAADGYVIHIGSGPDCNGTSACRISTFTARRSVGSSPTLSDGTRVPLPNGLTGVFSDSTCGTDCNNGFITWIEAGVRYSVGSRVASGPAVLDLAWRSIDRSLPTPSSPDVCGLGAPKHDGQVSRTVTTDVGDSRSIHWIVVCSDLGIDIEIIDSPGSVRWLNLDHVGKHGIVVRHEDGSSTMFAVENNRPRPVIDITTGGRLAAADLGCADLDGDGTLEAFDRASSEELRFLNPAAIRRIERDDLSERTIGDC